LVKLEIRTDKDFGFFDPQEMPNWGELNP